MVMMAILCFWVVINVQMGTWPTALAVSPPLPSEGVAKAPLPPGEGLGRGDQKRNGDFHSRIYHHPFSMKTTDEFI